MPCRHRSWVDITGVGDQHLALATLSAQRTLLPIVQEAGWNWGPGWTRVVKYIPRLPQGFESRTVQPVASPYTDYQEVWNGALFYAHGNCVSLYVIKLQHQEYLDKANAVYGVPWYEIISLCSETNRARIYRHVISYTYVELAVCYKVCNIILSSTMRRTIILTNQMATTPVLRILISSSP